MMQSCSRRGLLAGLALVASSSVIVAAQAQEVFIERAPPPPRHEVVPVLPRERAEREVWHPGAWHWNGHEYVWSEGHYVVRPHRGATWVPGHWDRRPRGWVYVEGHWA
jgi:hypothetical protein